MKKPLAPPLFSLRAKPMHWLVQFCILCCMGMGSWAHAEPDQKYLVLCYHSVPTVFNGDPDGVSVLNLAQQLAWLRESGYTAISMQDVIKAKHGMKPLPERAFLLTVDDGFADFYTHVFPLLKLFKVPAVFGLVGRWIEEPTVSQNETDPYFRQQRFVTWAQVKEMSDSGWVEIASHSYDLHHGIVANPQGNVKPAAVTLQYDKATKRYETPEQQRLRVRKDLEKNAALIEKHTGKPPRIMVWPYGAMDSVGVQEAASAGMPINFTLRDGLASTADIQAVERSLVGEELLLNKFSYMVKYGIPRQNVDPLRAINVNLDRIYDKNPAAQEEKLGRLIEQIRRLEINTVVINPFAETSTQVSTDTSAEVSSEATTEASAPENQAETSLRQAYFPNSVLPMRTDLLNRVTWQLRSRTSVNVYLHIPTSTIAQAKEGTWHTLDYANPQQREQLLTLYGDLSQHATAQGLLFDKDAGDPEATIFNKAVVQRMRYFKPSILSVVADGNAPQEPVSEAIATAVNVVQSSAKQTPELVVIGVKGAGNEAFADAVEKIRFFQRMGVSHFMLNSDDFLDDPQRFEQVRKAFSLKENPFL